MKKAATPKKTGTEFFDRVLIALIKGKSYSKPEEDIPHVLHTAEVITKARNKFIRDKIKKKKEREPEEDQPEKNDGAIHDLDL